MLFLVRLPKMLGQVKTLTWLSRCPWQVAAAAKVRLGMVWVGTDANQWSQTANPRARPDMIGSISGAYMPMISDGSVPGSVSLKPLAWSDWIAALKLMTNPWLVGTAPGAGSSVQNS